MLNIACTYLLLSTYSWLLFEAVYTVIILTLLEEKSLLEWISLTGWAAPIPMMIPYISYRLYYEDTNCWMQRNQRQATSHRCPHHILAEYDRTQMTVIKPVTTFQQLHRKRSSTSSLPSSPHCLAPRLAPRLAPGLRQASLALLMLAAGPGVLSPPAAAAGGQPGPRLRLGEGSRRPLLPVLLHTWYRGLLHSLLYK